MDDELGGSPSFYSVLGVMSDCSAHQIKQAYRKLAMQWHPDRWTRTPSLLTEAKRKFQQIQHAYSVLSDQNKRALYDMGLYEDGEDHDGYSDFVQEMVSLIAQEKRQKKRYKMEELQEMFTEMVQGFEQSSTSCCGSSIVGDYSRDSKKGRWECDSNVGFTF
ncbi:Chaperone DnaJ-domain superfamily protein [Euphorbia peplus]|nr:Chaperone DnaJ-domain superfamily protein [Euphorbia peplus]